MPTIITSDGPVAGHRGDPPVLRKPIDENDFAHTVAMIFARQLPSRAPTEPTVVRGRS